MNAYQKRHYEGIAQLVKSLTVYLGPGPGYDTEEQVNLSDLILALAEMFESDNPRFDRDRFFEAAHHG